MLLFGAVVAGAGAGVGLVGGLSGFRLLDRLSETPMSNKQVESYGLWKRSCIIGLLSSVLTLLAFSLGGRQIPTGLIGLTCLGVSFMSATLYVIGSLTVFRRFGPAILEAGELSLAVTIVLTILLSVCGVLWITLVTLGASVLLGATVLNGIWIYRLR